jgi:3-oxoacyl-[acyl-carrier protein] reductase
VTHATPKPRTGIIRRTPRSVITGGTRGIGAAVARRLAASQEVIVLGRAAGHAASVAVAAGIHVDHAEAANALAVEAAFARANHDGAGLTGLVVSAGIWEPTPIDGDPEAISMAHRRVLEINLLGTIHAVAAFVRHARPDAAASIVLVGSTAGQRGEAGYGAYSASKAALTGLAKSWAVELGGRGIRVNVVAPGWVDTDMTSSTLSDAARRNEIESAMPRGRVASPEDLAGPIAFLLSDDSLHVSGTVLSVNGGGVLASF